MSRGAWTGVETDRIFCTSVLSLNRLACFARRLPPAFLGDWRHCPALGPPAIFPRADGRDVPGEDQDRGPLGVEAERGPRAVEAGRGPRALEAGRGPRALEAGRGPRAVAPGRGPRAVAPGRGPRAVAPGRGPRAVAPGRASRSSLSAVLPLRSSPGRGGPPKRLRAPSRRRPPGRFFARVAPRGLMPAL